MIDSFFPVEISTTKRNEKRVKQNNDIQCKIEECYNEILPNLIESTFYKIIMYYFIKSLIIIDLYPQQSIFSLLIHIDILKTNLYGQNSQVFLITCA